MADRFPSLDEIDAGQTEARGELNFDLVDSTEDDFLARERAALGDEANQFTTAADRLATTVEDAGDDDLLGDGLADVGGQELGGFESSFPAIDTSNEHMAPGGTITGTTLPNIPGFPRSNSPYVQPSFSDEPEPDVIREWRERRDLALEHRDSVSAGKKDKTITEARTAIDDFYENYNNKKEKAIAQTRREAEEFLENREDTSAGGTSWERIAKLVDLSGKGARGGASGTGKERFRELLVSLRKDENAPGATGY
ncbi:hypothetical protein M501DRAFT_999767 [Patellaria atrata CBS 101060]|uniref:Clathrin light chain n=1 Tax=Patellaria atrata CBS 101060 TaxID=1346257 RepID=A0A9P4VNZ2_9PEZI|nr:hypothetical protein M501DRAFT_999767 [Patellaria atrata CBS 101060]